MLGTVIRALKNAWGGTGSIILPRLAFPYLLGYSHHKRRYHHMPHWHQLSEPKAAEEKEKQKQERLTPSLCLPESREWIYKGSPHPRKESSGPSSARDAPRAPCANLLRTGL